MKKTNIGLALICTSLILAGCNSSSSSSSNVTTSLTCGMSGAPLNLDFTPITKSTTNTNAIVVLTDPGYQGSDLGFINLTSNPLSISGESAHHQSTDSDFGLASFEQNFYRIGRWNIDTISKYSVQAPETLIYTYKTVDDIDDPTNNPHELVFVDNNKAYLLQYNSNKLWVVDPSSTTEESFKSGEIDLAGCADGKNDIIPEMKSGVIVNGKLYVILQNLTNYRPENTSKVVVIDTISNTIEHSIDLKTRNPMSITFDNGLGLVVASAGYSQCSSSCTETERTNNVDKSGVERIYQDGSTEVILEGASDLAVNSLAIANENQAYVSIYKGWGDEELRLFNPNTGVLESNALDNLSGFSIPNLTVNDNKLWVSINDDNPRISIYDTDDNTHVVDIISTQGYNPHEIIFLE